jgi:hypothetical protein
MNVHEHPRRVRLLSAIVGAVAAGYLWAVLFGDGVHGLRSGPQLDDAGAFPDANVAFLVAVACYLGSLWLAAWSGAINASTRLLRWLAATAVAGALVFALSRLFV